MELLTEPMCDPYFMGDEPIVVIDGMGVIEELEVTTVDKNVAPVTPLVMKRVYVEK